MVWQKKFPESCYSGAVSTAGGLVFVGQNNGEFQAYDIETGELLWRFQTGAGANTTVTPFEDEGEEKIAIYAGGNSLAATPHGENFWVFSLTGTMEEEKSTEKEAEGTEHKGEEEGKEAGEETPAEEGGEEAAAGGAPNAKPAKQCLQKNARSATAPPATVATAALICGRCPRQNQAGAVKQVKRRRRDAGVQGTAERRRNRGRGRLRGARNRRR